LRSITGLPRRKAAIKSSAAAPRISTTKPNCANANANANDNDNDNDKQKCELQLRSLQLAFA
jgi:hypothetical protein